MNFRGKMPSRLSRFTVLETGGIFLDKSASSFTSAPRYGGFEKSPEKLHSISEETATVIKCTLKAVSQLENDDKDRNIFQLGDKKVIFPSIVIFAIAITFFKFYICDISVLDAISLISSKKKKILIDQKIYFYTTNCKSRLCIWYRKPRRNERTRERRALSEDYYL